MSDGELDNRGRDASIAERTASAWRANAFRIPSGCSSHTWEGDAPEPTPVLSGAART
jgi:hypothetical protein